MKRYLVGAMALACASTMAQATTVNVWPGDMQGWVFFDDGTAGPCTGTCAMVNGPGSPPAGSGSARLTLVGTGERPTLGALLAQLAGQKLADIHTLSYSTYKTTPTAPGNVLAIALQFNVDNDVTDIDYTFKGRLVFEPYHDPAGLGQQVAAGQWQTWNTLAGKWWLSSAGNPARFPLSVCGQSSPCTVTQLLSYYPNIGIRDVPTGPNTYLKAGGGWSNFDGNTDALTIGIGATTTTYNFELGPTSEEQCKDGGWVGFFKNQGQCVSTFAKNK